MTKLSKDECAMVTTGKGTSIEIWMPEVTDKNSDIPPVMGYVLACAIRFHNDPEFVHKQLDWLEAFGARQAREKTTH